MNSNKDVDRLAIERMKLEISNELGIDIEKNKINKYDLDLIEKRIEVLKDNK